MTRSQLTGATLFAFLAISIAASAYAESVSFRIRWVDSPHNANDPPDYFNIGVYVSYPGAVPNYVRHKFDNPTKRTGMFHTLQQVSDVHGGQTVYLNIQACDASAHPELETCSEWIAGGYECTLSADLERCLEAAPGGVLPRIQFQPVPTE